MKTRAILLALPLLLAPTSCTRENRTSIDIQEICWPPTDCKPTAKCEAGVTGGVIMDINIRGNAPLFVQVANRLADNANKETGRTNTNDAHVDSINIQYSGVPVPSPGTISLTNQYIPAGGTTVLVLPAVDFSNLSAANVTALLTAIPVGTSATLISKIKLRGYLTDGSRFETGEFQTAIEVCNDCLSPTPCPPGKEACPFGGGMDPFTCGTTGG